MKSFLAVAAVAFAFTACARPAPPALKGDPFAARARAAGATDVVATAAPGGGTILDGTLEGRQFALAIPHDWNGEALLMAHGYSPPGSPVAVARDPLADDPSLGLLPRAYAEGVAVGHSAYDKAGVGVETGANNTLRLKRFLDRLGARRVYVAGGSMGGNIVMALIEDHPHEFAGAVTACGVDTGWEEEIGWLINLRAVYNYFTKGTPYALPGSHDLAVSGVGIEPPVALIGKPWQLVQIWRVARPVAALFKAAQARPDGPEAVLVKKIAALGETQPEPASLIIPLLTVTTGMDDMQATFGGVVAGNAGRVYRSDLLSPAENAALNRDIQRIATDPKAVAYADLWHRARGDFSTPLVTVHNAVDPLVPYAQAKTLGETVAKAGNGARLIQFTTSPVATPLPGTGLSGLTHCGFTKAQTGAAWDVLHRWVETGLRPAPTTLPAQ